MGMSYAVFYERIQKIIEEAEAALSQNSHKKGIDIVVDVETTGLNCAGDELLQVAIISAATGRTLYNSYIKPSFSKKWTEAEEVNHISPDMVKNCPGIITEMPKINAILRNAKTVIGYNVAFDYFFLRCKGAVFRPGTQFVDVMKDFAKVYGERAEWAEREWYEAPDEPVYKWQKLKKCAAYYGYKWRGKPHGSLADCRATLYCYKKMLETGCEIKLLPEWYLWKR